MRQLPRNTILAELTASGVFKAHDGRDASRTAVTARYAPYGVTADLHGGSVGATIAAGEAEGRDDVPALAAAEPVAADRMGRWRTSRTAECPVRNC